MHSDLGPMYATIRDTNLSLRLVHSQSACIDSSRSLIGSIHAQKSCPPTVSASRLSHALLRQSLCVDCDHNAAGSSLRRDSTTPLRLPFVIFTRIDRNLFRVSQAF